MVAKGHEGLLEGSKVHTSQSCDWIPPIGGIKAFSTANGGVDNTIIDAFGDVIEDN